MAHSSAEESTYLAMVVLKIAEPAGLKLAYRQPPPMLVVPIVPGATSKRAFVRAVVAQTAGAVKAPDHILKMPRGTGAGGRPLETVVASTAKHMQIVWSIAASPPAGFGSSISATTSALPSTLSVPQKDTPSNSFQAVTSLADLSDAEFHDCVRKLKSREASPSRAQEDYFVLEVQYSYEEQTPQQQTALSLAQEEEEFLPLPPIAMSTTRADFSPKKRLAHPAQDYQHSKQYEETLKNLKMLVSASSSGLMGPPGGSRSGSPTLSRPRYLPTLKEEPEDVEHAEYAEDHERTPRASEQKILGRKEVDPRLLPSPKTPVGSPRRRRQHRQKQGFAGTAHGPKDTSEDGRPDTYTPEVWGINKTILDDRIAAHEQQELPDENDNEAVERQQSPGRAGKKSRIPVVPSFHISSPRDSKIKKSASSPSLSDDYKKRRDSIPSSPSSLSMSQPKDNRPPEK
ncbi:hypothetical protein PG993_008461 [Apiospora rasikravindrae]|uniref:Uncharacterized protein n=1 Tax=Apiospora rasikravindrae TaxID=990691 RepID=A0ABR1T0E7_9PEZI